MLIETETPALSRPAASAVPSGSAVLGERRLITILFADLSGFTALSSRLDPEEVQEVANVCFEHLNKPIIGQGGTVHKYEGDLVIALFGYPLAHEDDPERAVKASFGMFELLGSINRALTTRFKFKTDLGLHMGITSGTVVVGEVGTPEKKEITVMGDSVNLASRLKDSAQRGEILVSEPVFRASRYLFDYEPHPPVSVKGVDRPVKVFRPLGVKAKPEPKRGIPGLFSPLVGRDRELEVLRKAVRQLAGGRGGAAFVLGDAGLGKSRLLEELKGSLADLPSPVTLLEGRCLSYGENVPYWPFLQILKEAFGIEDADPREAVQEKLLAGARKMFPESWDDLVPFLGYLLNVRFSEEIDAKGKYLDPQGLMLQTFLSLRRTLSGLARVRPLLLVIEDYHWIDSVSLEFLGFLFDSPEPLPLLCLCLSRIDKEKEGRRTKERLRAKLGEDFLELVLAPLDTGASTQLVHNLLKIPGIPQGFKDRILAKAEGNPFFLEEILRSLIDARVLVYSSGVWQLAAEVAGLAVPDTVQAVIASRLDRLEPEVRSTLEMAAVIGRSFYVPVLERLGGRDPMMVMLYLADLEEAEYIREARRQPEWEFIFRHPLLQEVAYQSLLKVRRRELHRRAGEAIEVLYPNRLDDLCELLAHQYVNGDDPERALTWLQKAGHRAKDRYAHDEAIAYFRQGIALLEEKPEGRAEELCSAYEALGEIYLLKADFEASNRCYQEMERRGAGDEVIPSRARRKRSIVLQNQSRYDEALTLLEEAEKTLSGDSTTARLERAQIYIARGGVHWVRGKLGRAIQEGEAALAIVAKLPSDAPGARTIEASGCNRLGAVHFDRGDYDRAIADYRKSIAISRGTGDKLAVARASGNLGIVYHVKGELDQARELYQACLSRLEEIGDQSGVGAALNNLGNIHYAVGEYDRAFELFQRAVGIAEEIGNRRSLGIARGNLGTVYEAKGDADRAQGQYRFSLETFEAIGYKQGIGEAHSRLGSVGLQTGRLQEAERHLRKSEAVLTAVGNRHGLVDVYRRRAELKNAQAVPASGPDPDALGWAEKALQLVEELKSKDGLGRCHGTFGKIYASSGDFQSSEEHFRKALAVFEELGVKTALADAWLEYARMLQQAAAKGVTLEGKAGDCLEKARRLYQDLNLPHKVKECQ